MLQKVWTALEELIQAFLGEIFRAVSAVLIHFRWRRDHLVEQVLVVQVALLEAHGQGFALGRASRLRHRRAIPFVFRIDCAFQPLGLVPGGKAGRVAGLAAAVFTLSLATVLALDLAAVAERLAAVTTGRRAF